MSRFVGLKETVEKEVKIEKTASKPQEEVKETSKEEVKEISEEEVKEISKK